MPYQYAERLCRELMEADSGEAVVEALQRAGWAHSTSALAPVAWHIIKDLSRLEETTLSDDADE